MTIKDLPALNAILNSFSALLLISGFIAIKKRKISWHQAFMKGALVTSTAFLGSYLVYHFHADMMTVYRGEGIWRWVYYVILATHVPLAAVMIPFILFTAWQAHRGNLKMHAKVSRIVLPVWLYVSVTGVLIYFMLYQW